MTDASNANDSQGPSPHATTMPATTIRAEEAAHFGQLAKDWWDPNGSSKMLHKLNPVRLGFIRAVIDAHWPEGAASVKPLTSKSAIDVGCGAGLLAEPLARMGATTSAVDAAAENIAAATAHAKGAGLTIDYHHGELAALELGTFDLVTSMEVIEHVADKPAFIRALAACLKPDGLMVLSTPNRTTKSRLLLIGAAEATGAVPKGTHHHEDFVTPDELCELLAEAGLKMGAPRGIGFSVSKGLHLSDDMALNYIVTAQF